LFFSLETPSVAKPKVYASAKVIKALEAARIKLGEDLFNKTNIPDVDSSGPLVFPLQRALGATILYFKAVAAGHGNKKAVKTLGAQLDKGLHETYADNGEAFRAVMALLDLP